MKFPKYFPRLFHPSVYQGKRKARNYFEGWYYKHVDAPGKQIWSIIFGISFSEDSHSFIQVIEGKTGKTEYFRFKKEKFSFEKKKLGITIAENSITGQSITLDLKGKLFQIQGTLHYQNTSSFPQKILSPGIMGWYTYAPFMECYHGVVSMNHTLQGMLTINNTEIDFSGGKGYIEKDWGRSMPSDWIWLQCNHFEEDPEMSMMVSIARIPWLTGHFPGFLSFIQHKGKVWRFATYKNTKIASLEINDSHVEFVLENKNAMLWVEVKRAGSGDLKAPVQGKMDRKIAESLDASVEIILSEKNGNILFQGKGKHAGLEVVGDVSQYIR